MATVSDLFEVRYGNSLELNKLELVATSAEGVAFVSRKSGDNGIAAFVRRIPGLEPAARVKRFETPSMGVY